MIVSSSLSAGGTRWMTQMASIVLLLCFLAVPSASQQCKDENGDAVDWYVMYKLPRQRDSENSLESEGLAYLYITSKTLSEKGWRLSKISVGDPKSIPGRTLAPLVHSENMAEDLLWVLYNDQPPEKRKVNTSREALNATSPPDPFGTKYGHTKGAVLTDGETGFWLVHSVPHFLEMAPDELRSSPEYVYPETAQHYGQSFLCVTLGKEALEEVGRQLSYNEPLVYASSIPESLSKQFPELSSAARQIRVESSPWFRQVEIPSVGGRKFISFAKAGEFGKELYGDWVASALKANLLVESWRNGAGKLNSQCHRPHWVENVEAVNLNVTSFKTTLDHSKWVVSNEEETDGPWICVGDINRMESQEDRGGGTVCLNDSLLWRAYRKAIVDSEECPGSLS